VSGVTNIGRLHVQYCIWLAANTAYLSTTDDQI